MQITVIFDVINKATRPLDEISKNFKGVTQTMTQLQECVLKFNKASELFQRMGQTVQQISQPFRDFQQGMADLSASTGLAGDDLKRLGEVARKTGVDSGLGIIGATEAFKLLASQIQVDNIGLEGLIELQRQTITLSQAAGMSMADAANVVAGTINQFGLQAGEANRVINVLAAGSKYGAAEIPDLAMSFKMVGAAANAAGLTIESTAGAIEVLSKNNLKGADAGTALRNILQKMQTEMGVDFNKTSLAEALEKLKPKYKDAAYMSKLFGMENMAAAQFLVASADKVADMTQNVTATQTATEMAQISTGTWNHKLKVQAARFNEWSMQITEGNAGIMNLIQVGGQAFSMISPLSSLLSGGLSILKGGYGIFKGAAHGIGAVAKAGRLMSAALNAGKLDTFSNIVSRYGISGRIAAAGIWVKNAAVTAWNAIGAASNAVTTKAFWLNLRHAAATKLSAIWTAVCSKAQLIGSTITSICSKRTAFATLIQGGLTNAMRLAKVTMLTGVIPALTGVIASTWAWTAALLSNPITWVVLAIGALVAGVVVCWQTFAEFRAVILTIWDTIKGFGEAIFNWVVAPFRAAFEFIGGVVQAVKTLFNGGSLEEAGAQVANGFQGGIKAGTDSLGKSINGFKDTAGGISGNYQTRLAMERAKQEERERKNGTQKKPGTPAISGFEGLDKELNIPTGTAMPGMLGTGKNQAAAPVQNVSVNYNPNVNISSEMTQKSREDLMKLLKENAAEFARIIRDEFRRSERGEYGLS